MQASLTTRTMSQAARPRTSFRHLGRMIRYLSRYKHQAVLPYLFLVIAILSQLAVPRLIRNMIDAVTGGYLADRILRALEGLPPQVALAALPTLLEVTGRPSSLSLDQFRAELQAWAGQAMQTLIWALSALVVFAVLRGVFAFLQAFWAEKSSQSVAYDLRNELYAKIQTLSFSYHDRNQTGQLMIRATDDVEKVRLFIGQGLLQLVGALVHE